MSAKRQEPVNNPFDKDTLDKMASAIGEVVDERNTAPKEQRIEINVGRSVGKSEALSADIAGQLGALSEKVDEGVINAKAPGIKDYTRDEILPLMDSLLQNGYAIYSFRIKNMEVILRTRFTWEEQYIYKHMESAKLETALSYQREFSIALMAASLAQYGQYQFEVLNHGSKEALEKNFKDRYEFVLSLNNVVTDIIQKKLYDFDDKQRYLIANFDELLQDF
jgi:hypothetical protein